MTHRPILVVGAGPVGLLMAAELARHGAPVRLVERAAAPSDRSRAIGVHARTLEVLEDLGLAEAFVAAGRPVHATNVQADGRRLARLTFEGLPTRYPFVLMLPQDRTEALLAAHAEALGVRIERGVALEGLVDRGTYMEATLNGEIVEADWVVGCDGAHSVVRRAIGLDFAGAAYAEDWSLLDATCRSDWAMDEIHAFLHPAGLLAVFPLGPDRVRVFATRAPGDPPVDFQRALDERARPGMVLGETLWTSDFRVHHRIASGYRVGRAFIAGDAAHIHSPVGGQGMNTGMQDAHNLAWKLARVATGRAAPAILDSYQAERRPIAEGVLAGTDVLTRGAATANPLLAAVRNLALSIGSHVEPLRRMAAATATELIVAYPPGPLVGPGAGGHAPIRYGGPGWTLLNADGPDPGALADVSVISDPDAATRAAFGIDRPTYVLIRPDGYIGFRDRAPDPARLRAYLARLGGATGP